MTKALEYSENRNLLHKSKLQKDNAGKKSRAMNRQEIADETWAKHIFFTEEAKRKKMKKDKRELMRKETLIRVK